MTDIVYRIQTIVRLIFNGSSIYKLFNTQDNKITKSAVERINTPKIPKNVKPELAEFDIKCNSCGKIHKIYAELFNKKKLMEMQKKGDFFRFRKITKSNVNADLK